MRKITFVITILLLASLILAGISCGQGPISDSGEQNGSEEEAVNVNKEMSTEDFYNKYCPDVMANKPGLYKDVNECIQVQSPGEKGLYSSCMKSLNDEEKCKERVWKNWRQVFLKNLAGK